MIAYGLPATLSPAARLQEGEPPIAALGYNKMTPGPTIRVKEGDKERVQVYAGIVIARKGAGIHETFTVRRLSYGEGVERVFPVNSPNIEKVEVERESEAMKARLYYLRRRTGKAAVAIKEKDRAAEIHAAKMAAAVPAKA